MKKINDKLSELFEVDPIDMEIQVIDEVTTVPILIEEETENVVNIDTDFARKNLKTLIEKGTDAVDEILQVAKHSEHPRAYEVAANFIKSMAELNKDLLEIQKRKNDLQGIKGKGPNNDVNIDKAVFVGSTSELMKLIRKEN